MIRVLICDGLDKTAISNLVSLGIDVVNEHYDVQELENNIKLFDVAIVRSATRINKNIIDEALKFNKLKLIIRGGVGLDNIDVKYATANGIEVQNTPNASSESVAELALAHMFSLARCLNKSNVTIRQGKWNKKQYVGIELKGKTIGIIGMGRVGTALAYKCSALEMNVIYYDELGRLPNLDKYDFKEFEDLLRISDFISINVSGSKLIIGKDELSKMKKDSFLINCSRGKVIDEDALVNALDNGVIAGAGLDVYYEEPSHNLRLLNNDKVSVTPHIGASTKEAQEKVGEEVVSIIKNFFSL